MQVSASQGYSNQFPTELPQKTEECTALIPYKAASEVIRESLEKWKQMPCIAYLKGTCSAGKSTFGRTLESQSRNWVFIDEDVFYIRRYCELIAERFPQEYATASCAIASSNLYHAFYRNIVVFHEKASASERTAASEAVLKVQLALEDPAKAIWKLEAKRQIQSELVAKIQAAFRERKKVLLDSWLFTAAEVQARFGEARVVRVLLYCPLPVAMLRLQKRNQEGQVAGNIESNRFTGQLMSSFCGLYAMSKTPKSPIECVEKTVFETQFAAMASDVKKANTRGAKKIFMNEEMPQDVFQRTQAQFMQPYVVESADALFIAPKDVQDVIINNSGNTQKALELFEESVEIV
jgi:hypothetical protein